MNRVYNYIYYNQKVVSPIISPKMVDDFSLFGIITTFFFCVQTIILSINLSKL